MREQNSTKKTRRWPPQVGKRHRRDGNATPEQAPKSEAPAPGPVHENHGAPSTGDSQGRPVVVSRRSQLRAVVARRRHDGLPADRR